MNLTYSRLKGGGGGGGGQGREGRGGGRRRNWRRRKWKKEGIRRGAEKETERILEMREESGKEEA